MYDIQKASILKRVSAWILDVILLSILISGFAWVISDAVNLDVKGERIEQLKDHYAAKYNITTIYTQAQLETLPEEERLAYEAAKTAAEEEMAKDAELMELLGLYIQLVVIMTSLSTLFAVLILDFAVPMLFGNGQTVGKKIFGLAVIRNHGVKINGVCLFIRSILGKCTVEIMIPLLCVVMFFLGMTGLFAVLVVAILLLVQLVLLIVTRNNALIHDIMADTVVVEMASQMIFQSEQERLEYQQREAAEKAARQAY